MNMPLTSGGDPASLDNFRRSWSHMLSLCLEPSLKRADVTYSSHRVPSHHAREFLRWTRQFPHACRIEQP